MRPEEMKYFVEVVRTKSINKASRNLFVAQPAISRAIASMEKELGFSLLERSNHGVSITSEGMIVFDDCVSLLEQLDKLKKKWAELSYQVSEECNDVHIVSLPVVCNRNLMDAISTIRDAYPKINPILIERKLDAILKVTMEEKGICISHYNDKTKNDIFDFAKKNKMQIVPLFDDEYVLFANAAFAKQLGSCRLSDIKQYELITYSKIENIRDKAFTDAGLNVDQWSFEFKNVMQLSNLHLITAAGLESDKLVLGANISTFRETYRMNGGLQKVDVQDFSIPMTVFLMYPQDAKMEVLIVAEIIQQEFEKLQNQYYHGQQ